MAWVLARVGLAIGIRAAMVGAVSILTPSAVEAAAAVPRLEESEFCTAVAVAEVSSVVVTLMITLAVSS